LDKLSSAKEVNPEAKLANSGAILLEENSKQLVLHLKANVFKELDGQIINTTDDATSSKQQYSKQLIYKRCCPRR